MVRKRSPRFQKALTYSLLLGLAALIYWMVAKYRNNPEAAIRREFKKAGVAPNVIDYWVAVAKHETAGFTSRVFKDSNNMFGMKLARRNTLATGQLPYGEGQAIFKSVTDSAKDQILYFTKRFQYPSYFDSAESLVRFMKSKGYFEADLNDYIKAVALWMKK